MLTSKMNFDFTGCICEPVVLAEVRPKNLISPRVHQLFAVFRTKSGKIQKAQREVTFPHLVFGGLSAFMVMELLSWKEGSDGFWYLF